MPVPIVNVMVVVLRNSLAPINRVITNTCTRGSNHSKHPGFMFFRGFGYYCHTGEATMNKFLRTENASEDGKIVDVLPSDRELFKIGVEWWSEIFIFYGLLSAIAVWEIGKFAKKSQIQQQRVVNLETDHKHFAKKLLAVEDRAKITSEKTSKLSKEVQEALEIASQRMQ